MNKKLLSAILLTGGLAIAGGWFYFDHRIRSEVELRLQAAVDQGHYQDLSFEDMTYTLNGEVTLHKLHVSQPDIEYQFEEVHIIELDTGHEFPHQLAFTVHGLSLPGGLPDYDFQGDATLRRYLESLENGEVIPLDFSYRHDYQPQQELQFEPQIHLNIPGFASMEFSGTFRELDIDQLVSAQSDEPDLAEQLRVQARINALVEDIEIAAMKLSLADSGAVQLYLETAAAQVNASADDFRQLVASQARNAWLFLPEQAKDLAKDYGEQLALFLEGGRTMTLSINPAMDGSLKRLQPQIMGAALTGDYAFITELLDLTLLTE